MWANQRFDDEVSAAADRIWARQILRRGGLIVLDPFLALRGPPLRPPTGWSIFRGSAAEWRSLVSAGAPVSAPTLSEALESWWREVDAGSATPAALQRLNYFRLAARARALGGGTSGTSRTSGVNALAVSGPVCPIDASGIHRMCRDRGGAPSAVRRPRARPLATEDRHPRERDVRDAVCYLAQEIARSDRGCPDEAAGTILVGRLASERPEPHPAACPDAEAQRTTASCRRLVWSNAKGDCRHPALACDFALPSTTPVSSCRRLCGTDQSLM